MGNTHGEMLGLYVLICYIYGLNKCLYVYIMCLPVDGFIYGSNMVYMGTILMVSLIPTIHIFQWDQLVINQGFYPQQVFGCELFNGLVFWNIHGKP